MFKKVLITFLLVGLSIIVFLPSVVKASEIPKFEITSFDSVDNIEISGDWLYVNGLVEPDEIESSLNEGEIVQIPNQFKAMTDSNEATGTFATYVTIPKYYVGKDLALHIPYEYSAFNLYIDNKLVANSGQVGINAETHKSSVEPVTVYFTPNETKALVTMQISNYGLIRGGFIYSMKIGTASSISQALNTELIITSILIGCVFVVALFTLIIGYYRSYGKEILIFGLFCLSITLRELCSNPHIYSVVLVNVDWMKITRLDYIFTCFSTFFFFALIYTITDKLFKKWVFLLTSANLLLINLIVLFTNIEFFQRAFFVLYLCTLPMSLYGMYVLIKAVRTNRGMALSNIIGIGMVFIAVVTEFFCGLGLITIPPFTFYATLIYVAIQLIFLSKQFSNEVFNRIKLNEELIELNQSLDQKILTRTQELQNANDLLQTVANIDALTGIYNRHYFNEYMTLEFTHSIEKSIPLGILIIDVDDFKKYNDFYGHIEGDKLLKELATHMGEVLPESGMLARYGGEEFVIVLSDMKREQIITVAEEVKNNIEAHHLVHEGREEGIITVSIGIATLDETSDYITMNDFINAADQKLYIGKNTGKNKVVF